MDKILAMLLNALYNLESPSGWLGATQETVELCIYSLTLFL